MPHRIPFARILSPFAVLLASCGVPPAGDSAIAQSPAAQTQAGAAFAITDVASFDEPWALAFIPGSDRIVVTEKAGKIKLVAPDGKASEIAGAPKVDYGGQGGLGDVLVVPGPDAAGWSDMVIYLSWAEAGSNNTRGAVVGRGTLECTEAWTCRIVGLTPIWQQSPKVSGRGHYSHRLALSPDGKHLFVASGDRQKMTPAQDKSANLGKIVRLNLDGTPAVGNPFAGEGGIAAQVWSLGHRNILGLAFDAQGRLWDLEHGPAGGDELNLVKAGANYGWPVVSQGDHYDGKAIPRHPTRSEFAAPAISWNPVIAPGDFIFVSGKAFPAWQGQALIAAMGTAGLVRVAIDGDKAREIERIDLGNRIRDIVEAPDGSIWVIEDGEGAKLRKLTPKR